jgi:hypothetical protein
MAINPVNPGPVFGETAYQNNQRASDTTARNARESEQRPQASVPEANQRVNPNQASSESNTPQDTTQGGRRSGLLDFWV